MRKGAIILPRRIRVTTSAAKDTLRVFERSRVKEAEEEKGSRLEHEEEKRREKTSGRRDGPSASRGLVSLGYDEDKEPRGRSIVVD